jgi:hypothetical protein
MQLPKEFLDVKKVLEFGARKYSENGWLKPNAHKMNHTHNVISMTNHLEEHECGSQSDHESGLDPLLHLACRALMRYTRKQRGIEHEKDTHRIESMLDLDPIWGDVLRVVPETAGRVGTPPYSIYVCEGVDKSQEPSSSTSDGKPRTSTYRTSNGESIKEVFGHGARLTEKELEKVGYR